MGHSRLAAIGLAIFLLLGCGGPVSRQQYSAEPHAGSWEIPALSDTKLQVVASTEEDVMQSLADAFEKRTGCHITFAVMPPAPAASYLMQADSRADIYLGGTTDIHETLKMGDTLMYRQSPADSDAYSWRYNDHDDFWEPVSLEMLSIGVNELRFAAEFPGQPLPVTLEDLTDPMYRGKLVMADPDTTNGGLTLALSVLRSHGREEGARLLRALGSNVGEFAVTDLEAAQKAALGNYPLTLGLYSCQYRMRDTGFPLKPAVYSQAGWSIVPVSILKNCRNPEAAEAFLKFVTSREGEELFCAITYAIPARDDVTAPESISHQLRDYPVSEAFWSYRETSQREYAQMLMNQVKEEVEQHLSFMD